MFAQLNDEPTLLAINKELVVPGWGVNGTNFCNWKGIDCDLNQAFVVKLDLSRLQL